jgi:hypothetical protein
MKVPDGISTNGIPTRLLKLVSGVRFAFELIARLALAGGAVLFNVGVSFGAGIGVGVGLLPGCADAGLEMAAVTAMTVKLSIRTLRLK